MILGPERCDPQRLDLFLHNRLPQEGQRSLEAHLHVCLACRNKLDELAGGARWWKAVRRHLGESCAAQSSSTSDHAAACGGVTIDLNFLQPSENPAALGRLGPYDVLEVLGQGGMGVVLKAFDESLHRPVAIKVLAAEYAANGAVRKRFAREAQAAAAVIHDHVVPVHAVDAQATPPYLVMAFIPGQSLQQRIDRSGSLELKEILRIGMQTASGLAAAHAQGLVHRDIKPANIMLENGIERVRITDFGLARAVGDASITQSGAVAGTPQYMVPSRPMAKAWISGPISSLWAARSTPCVLGGLRSAAARGWPSSGRCVMSIRHRFVLSIQRCRSGWRGPSASCTPRIQRNDSNPPARWRNCWSAAWPTCNNQTASRCHAWPRTWGDKCRVQAQRCGDVPFPRQQL